MALSLILYRRFLLPLLHGGARLVGLFSRKVADGLEFRREWRDGFERFSERPSGSRSIHVHVASAGEYEQARGIVDELLAITPDLRWTLSFSSPSGIRHLESERKNMDVVTPVPLDLPVEIDHFLDLLRPDAILFIRYDLWPHLCLGAMSRNIPMFLAAASFGGALSRSLVGFLVRPIYQTLSFVSAISESDRRQIARHIPNVPVSNDGDPRLARVRQRSRMKKDSDPDLRTIREWLGDRRSLVVGSSWAPDERRVAATDLPDGVARIIVPHAPSSGRIQELLDIFPEALLLSSLGEEVHDSGTTLIVDRLGILTELYSLATVAWIGGGFGEGVHSVAEAAFYGVPLLSGPRIFGSHEARQLCDRGGLQIVRKIEKNSSVLLRLLSDEDEYSLRAESVQEWSHNTVDAGTVIARRIHEEMKTVRKERLS